MQMGVLETTFLTGLHGENMMIPFNTTLLGLYFYNMKKKTVSKEVKSFFPP